MRGVIIALVAATFVAALPADADARGRRGGGSGGRGHSGGYGSSGGGYSPAPAYTPRSGHGGGSAAAAARTDCTRSDPCIGPRGGRYYYTASGSKQYLPR